MPRKASTAVLLPNLGLYYDRPALAIPTRGLLDGNNFRIRDGTLTNRLLGWTRFGSFTLDGPVTLISNFLQSDGTDDLIFGTPTSLYLYDPLTETVSFLNSRYVTGTAAASGTSVTGTGTSWSANAAAGDYIHFGAANYNDPTGTWYLIDAVPGNTSITLHTSAGIVADGPYTIRHSFTGDIHDHWDTAIFINASPDNADLWFATNGVDDVVKWNPANTQVTDLSSLGFTARHLAVFSNMMIYGNLNQGGTDKPSTIINSDIGAPADVTGGLSEEFVVHGGPEGIIDMVPLGDNLAIYSEKSHITLAQFVGDPLVFAFRQSSATTGPVGPRVVANFEDFHEFLAPDGQYKYDGATLQAMGKQVWPVNLRSRDPSRSTLGFNHFDEENGELIWVVPYVTDPGADTSSDVAPATAFTEHYTEEVGPQDPTPISKRDFPFTAAGYYTQQGGGETWATVSETWEDAVFRWNEQLFFSDFPLSLVGDIDGKIYTLNTSQTMDGTAFDGYVHFGRRVLGDARMRGLLSRVYPFAVSPNSGTFDLDVILYLSDHAAGPATATDAFPFDISLPFGGHFVSTFRRARFFEPRFSATGVTDIWALEGYDIDIRIGGSR